MIVQYLSQTVDSARFQFVALLSNRITYCPGTGDHAVRTITHAATDAVTPKVPEIALRAILRVPIPRVSTPRRILAEIPGGEITVPVTDAPDHASCIGWVEGWRGEVLIVLETGPGNRIRRCHPHDPSWQNWPLLERAVLGNIVPDFPLINKSFNLSYAVSTVTDLDGNYAIFGQIRRGLWGERHHET